MILQIVPVSLEDANLFVARFHRHHKPVVGHKFSIGVSRDAELAGVCIVSRPVSRHRQDGFTLEVSRCCTDGTRNACSMLYRAAWRAAAAIGYKKLITYTLPEEGGASLRGAGFKFVGINRGGSWNVPSRPRTDKAPTSQKSLWEIAA